MDETISDIFKYIRSYYLSGFKWACFLIVILLLSAIIYFNYFPTDIFAFPTVHGRGAKYFQLYLLYFLPFAVPFFVQSLFFKHNNYLKSKWFYVLLFAAPAIFSVRTNFNFYEILLQKFCTEHEFIFWKKTAGWLVKSILTIGVIYFFVRIMRQKFYVYRHTNSGISKPYIWLLLCMLPVIIVASFQPAFLAMYPRAQFIYALQLPAKFLHTLLFEFSYVADLISIEAFFRGFLIITFMRVCGMRCILPAACFYCCIHLGKPMMEAISSFWGAMLLGIISYHTKSIWGGVIIHVGIAMFMEMAGSIIHYT